MSMEGAPTLRPLTPRERDCLRLLQYGFDTAHAAAGLGISPSTFNKHLASARRKLGVTRTMHALLLLSQLDGRARTADGGDMAEIDDFATAIEDCVSLDDTFAVLRSYAQKHGVTQITLGVSAEPPGQLTNGARAIAMSYPEEMQRMYSDMGGALTDPTVPYTVTHTAGLLVDNERLIMAVAGDLPKAVMSMGDALLDNEMRFAFHQPERDAVTRAPMQTAFVIDPRAVGAYVRGDAPGRAILGGMSRVFWETVQRKCMLPGYSGLTQRQIEALTFAARGFGVTEIAEHMHVSRRSVEKILAGARERLGARTTAAAVYRALVYRALG
jgi:DNA-binding CsgD family transcriptional regulator